MKLNILIETIVIALIVLDLVFSILIDIKSIKHLNYILNQILNIMLVEIHLL